MIGQADEAPPDPRGSDQSGYPFKLQWCVCIPSSSELARASKHLDGRGS